MIRALSGRWPRQELMVWGLHIIVDIPTHSRQPWGPRFLWPLSHMAVDGIPWAEAALRALDRAIMRRGTSPRQLEAHR